MVKKDIYETMGEKLHVEAKRKPRAKRVVSKKRELAAPYGRTTYKTPCISQGVRDVLLGTAGYYTMAFMSTYDPTFVAQQAEKMLRNFASFTPPHISARP